jgi:hypothetical protein
LGIVSLAWLLAVPFVWDAPQECPGQEEVAAEVARLLEDSAAQVEDRWAVARARQEPDGWSVRVWVTDGASMFEREVATPTCEEAARAAAVIASMALAPDGEPEREPPPAPEPEDLDAILEEIEQRPPRPTTPDPPSEPELEIPPPIAGLQIVGLAGVGALPTVDGGIRIAPVVVWPRARLELGLSYFARRLVSFGDDDRASFQMFTAGVRGCFAPSRGRFEFPLCGGLEAGAMIGDARGFRFLHASTRPWVAVASGAGMLVRLGRRRPPRGRGDNFALYVGFEPWVSLLRPPHVGLDGEVHRSALAGIRGVLGLEVRFESPGVRR